jgi:hypothetical protein
VVFEEGNRRKGRSGPGRVISDITVQSFDCMDVYVAYVSRTKNLAVQGRYSSEGGGGGTERIDQNPGSVYVIKYYKNLMPFIDYILQHRPAAQEPKIPLGLLRLSADIILRAILTLRCPFVRILRLAKNRMRLVSIGR